VICKLSFLLLSLRTVNTVTHSYDTSAVLTHLLMAKNKDNSRHLFQVSTVFLPILLCQISCSTSRLTEYFKQVRRHYSILNSGQFPLNFLLHFSFDNLIFLTSHSCVLVQMFSKLTNMHSSDFGINVSQHQTTYMLL